MVELITMVIYDVEDDWARTLVAEACKDFGLVRVQYSCFRGKLSGNKREELYERFRKIQRDWQQKWYKDLPQSRFEASESPDIPGKPPTGRWQPSFKIMIQPLCEKDVSTASYAYMYMDVPEFAQTAKQDAQKMPAKQDAQKMPAKQDGQKTPAKKDFQKTSAKQNGQNPPAKQDVPQKTDKPGESDVVAEPDAGI